MDISLDRRSMLAGAFGAAASLALPGCAARRSPRTFFDRIGRPIGLQLYALGDEPQKDLEGTLRRVAAIGYRDIEMPGLLGREPGAVRSAADAAGVAISSVHTGIVGNFSIRSDPQRIVDVLGALGAKHVVVPMFPFPPGFKLQPGENFAVAITRMVRENGETMWKQLAQLLNERAAALKPHGIAVGYHNHSVEFMPIGSRTGWEILADETDPALVHFEADIGWLVSAGVDPLAFFKRYKGRVRQLHVKDVKRGFKPSTAMETAPTEVGAGSVDWARVLPAAHAAGARHFYVEQEPPFTMTRMEAAAQSYAFLAQLRA
jgi:sugar phosphate isomerase/epimerase